MNLLIQGHAVGAEPTACQWIVNMRHEGPKAVLFLELKQ